MSLFLCQLADGVHKGVYIDSTNNRPNDRPDDHLDDRSNDP